MTTTSSTRRPVPRWAVTAAHLAVLSTVPSGLWRIAMGLQIPVGFTEIGLRLYGIPGWGTVYVFGLSLFTEALALLTLGLVRGWGEVFPHWIPRLGGRRVPPLVAIVPAFAGAITLTMLTWNSVRIWSRAAATLPPGSLDPDPIFETVMAVCYAPLLLWGPLLGIVTVHYALRRRDELRPTSRSRQATAAAT